MKKVFVLFSVIAVLGMISCKNSGIKQEDMDKLNAQVVEKETTITKLQGDIDLMKTEMDALKKQNDSLLVLTAPKATKPTTTKPAAKTEPKPATTVTPTKADPKAVDQKKRK